MHLHSIHRLQLEFICTLVQVTIYYHIFVKQRLGHEVVGLSNISKQQINTTTFH